MTLARLVLLAGLLSRWGTAVAQIPVVGYADTIRIQSLPRPPRWVVSLAPLALFDPENTIQLGVERLLAGRHSVLGEIGYGPGGLNLYRSALTGNIRETWRGRAEWRIYTRRSRASSRWQSGRTIIEKPLGNYVALDLFYKQTNATESGSVGRACEDGTCQYFQRFQSRVVKYVEGMHVKVGKQGNLYIPDRDGRVVLDIYIGLGLRRRLVKEYSLPEPEDGGIYVFTNRNRPFSNPLLDNPVRLSMAAGFRVGYVF